MSYCVLTSKTLLDSDDLHTSQGKNKNVFSFHFRKGMTLDIFMIRILRPNLQKSVVLILRQFSNYVEVEIATSTIYIKNNQADLCKKCCTHSSQHDANYQPPEGPDADE